MLYLIINTYNLLIYCGRNKIANNFCSVYEHINNCLERKEWMFFYRIDFNYFLVIF